MPLASSLHVRHAGPPRVPSAVRHPAEAAVRVTVLPGADVLLGVGTRLGDARETLAELTCRPELRTAPLVVDGVPVDDDQRCGTRPLLPGATVAVARPRSRSSAVEQPVGDPRRADEVLAAPLHLAVHCGADSGRLVPVAATARGRLSLDDLDVRWRTGRRGPRVRVRAPRGTRRVPDDADVPVARAARAGRTVARWRRTVWRPGQVLVTPHGAYALRPRPLLAHGPRTGPTAPTSRRDDPGRPSAAHLATALTPAVASLALAVTFRQPLYALLALVGPLALLVPALVEARRRRAARSAAHRGTVGPGRIGDARHADDEDARAPVDPLRPRPADVLTWAAVAVTAPATGTARGTPRSHPVAADAVAAPAGTPAAARLPDGCAAVVGPRDRALAAARAVLAELLASGVAPTVHAHGRARDWAWCRWFPGASWSPALDDVPAPRSGRAVLVVDGAPPPGALTRAWDRLRPTGTDVLLVVDDARQVPAWCRTVLDVTGTLAVVTGPDGARTARDHVGVSDRWATGLTRRLAAADHLGRLVGADPEEPDPGDPTSPALPGDVALGHLLDAPSDPDELVRWVRRRWETAARRDGNGLRVVLGAGPGGDAVPVDLVRDGPHVLVAGTTGAGKSELLQTLVVGLALGRSPDELSFALVDFKGGASFGACGGLPHVVGQVTDLDPGLAGRALAGLRAELHRRERVLATVGATDVDDLPRGRLPRLVVVVDEFRALADDLPDLLPGLLRIAAQGRSLGVHLVLATQRPAGAVGADVRANITLRLALRVVDAADSRDVVESPLAALVPASTPGRLVLRRGAEPPLAVQCARAGAPPPSTDALVRLAPAWGSGRAPEPAPDDGGPLPGRVGSPAAEDLVPWFVDAAREAAGGSARPHSPPPWLPALPTSVRAADLADAPDDSTGGDGLPVALGDLPASQRREVVRWDPRDGHLAVLGGARSGRTTALRTLARAALARGWTVHAVGSRFGDLGSHPAAGTVVDRTDPRRLVRLLRLLVGHDDGQDRPPGHGAAAGRVLVLVDDVEAVRATLAAVANGAGADALGDALADSPAAFVVSGSGPTVGGLVSLVGVRCVLASRDRHDDVSRGVPTPLAGQGGAPGRAVWLGPGEPLLCQVALPDVDGPTPGARGRDAAGAGPAAAVPPGRVRLLRLPDRVRSAELADPATDTRPGRAATGVGPGADPGLLVPVGLGGDDATTVCLDVSRGALVAGPPGSGRTSALTLLARHVARSGALRAVVARDDALAAVAAGAGAHHVGRYAPAELGAVLDTISGAGAPGTVVVDDLDLLAQLCVLEADRLATACRDGLVLLASATTGGAATALRGALADLRGTRTGIVLAPGERGSGEVFGHRVDLLADPGRPRPGRGVLVRGSRLTPVQVATP
ncbi:FtsK/SpoIIIE domain-containing protein [Cellulosimicrobium protaetiae]|uniref:FtsK domain-containing protein n=1 Tax=Cellulosimicrobium protaetiae TaxID=2587808 RepID=A0A6M5UFV2_9MICO|nr:FtsK/SpoIIIE domain-containing protein [Cellulosimicrobium protaetiae]QJW36073.1 hypothetical protein FIC82_007540 [Cellulosimicrobium protaetiae]